MIPQGLRLGVLGSPLAHSKSPQIQNAGLKFLGIDGDYVKYEIVPDEFDRKIRSLLCCVDGLNVTIPYKEKILKYLNRVDPLVERIGAANTLVIKDGQIHGYNTDYYGFMESLRGVDLQDQVVSIIGAGGAARAVVIALEDLKVSKINVYVRNPEKADGNLPYLKKTDLEVKLLSETSDLSDSALIINSTPLGQGRLQSSMPLEHHQIRRLQKNAVVYDLIYSKTMLLEEAEQVGLRTIDGSQMLVLQAAKSLTHWTGRELSPELIAAMSLAH